MQEDEASNYLSARRRKKWIGWRPKDDEAKNEFQKALMGRKDENQEENLEMIQHSSEKASRNVARSTKKTNTKP